MIQVLRKIFGTKQDRDIKNLLPIINKINNLEKDMKKMSDDELKAQTAKFQKMIADGASMESILPEAFATVREASVRVLKMRHFDVQLIGGIVLHQGKIAEMKTGEGKTLVATLPLYLNALSGKGAHLVTVNDYLAQRDAEWMGQLYKWLGLSVGCIINDMDDEDRKIAYQCDITYGTNNEYGFDYLRDNMKFSLADYVQRELNFCIVDEVDSILIDEARTPLLISGPSEGNVDLYKSIDKIIPKLKIEEHYTVDEKTKSAVLTDNGINQVQKILNIKNLYEMKNMEILHHVNQALRAHTLFAKDVDYVVKDGKVIIVDEFTGRLKDGSRWSDGLHQAVEAKEQVKVKSENQTLASITFQNYFKLYKKLAGMTGTADTEAEEFGKIYNLDVIVIPTNVPMIRIDQADVIYASKNAKYKAVANLIKDLHQKGQPALVGTITIDSSEILSKYLTQDKIPHEVLNAKQHEREASIVANAGAKGAVTIATNMAGRGTDIKLNDEVKELGGLYIIGTERHESRRIDNQLRGRSGRQGDPGNSKFFLSLEDDLMRIFGSDRIKSIMTKLGMQDNEPIEHKMISNAIAKAQKKVEGHNFDIRKHLLDFDNVMNEQRLVIYQLRKEILDENGNNELLQEMIEDVCHNFVQENKPPQRVPIDEWKWNDIANAYKGISHSSVELNPNECSDKFDGNLFEYVLTTTKNIIDKKFAGYKDDQVSQTIREVLLSTIDTHWKNHLLSMDHLKEGINLRSYGQKDPLVEYKREAFLMYENMKLEIKKAIVSTILGIKLYTLEEIEELKRAQQAYLEAQLEAHKRAQEAEAGKTAQITRKDNKVGRNDLCPCGSGKKFKHCHGR